jgi:hypothetical protein
VFVELLWERRKPATVDEARSFYVRAGCCIRLEQTSAASKLQITLKSPFTAALGLKRQAFAFFKKIIEPGCTAADFELMGRKSLVRTGLDMTFAAWCNSSKHSRTTMIKVTFRRSIMGCKALIA